MGVRKGGEVDMRKLREGEVRKQNDKGNEEARQWKD